MKVFEQEFRHPTQPSVASLRLFQQPQGFLLLEERLGTVSVYKTLGLFTTREAAEQRARDRAEQLRAQRWEPE